MGLRFYGGEMRFRNSTDRSPRWRLLVSETRDFKAGFTDPSPQLFSRRKENEEKEIGDELVTS